MQRNGNRTSGSTARSIEVGGMPALPKPVPAGAGELLAAEAATPPPGDVIADIVVYGATPSGVMAAVSASGPGANVVVVEPSEHVGGMMSNGLTATDFGHTAMLGELCVYLRRAGHAVDAPVDMPDPWASALAGDGRDAAAAWEALGERYEHAVELASTSSAGLSILRELGAAATVRALSPPT